LFYNNPTLKKSGFPVPGKPLFRMSIVKNKEQKSARAHFEHGRFPLF